MKFLLLALTTQGLMILCMAASLSQEKVIYHQTMTPTWLEAHASYIDSSRSTTTEQLTFNAGSSGYDLALLKVPMIPAGWLQHPARLTVKILVANDVSIGETHDSDISYGISDEVSFVGFKMNDKGNYGSPCFGFEGTSGTTLTNVNYPSYSPPHPSNTHYPGQFVVTFKVDERWGSCYTAHDAGYLNTAVYNNRLMLNKGLTLEVYKEQGGEKVGIKYIEVTVIQDN